MPIWELVLTLFKAVIYLAQFVLILFKNVTHLAQFVITSNNIVIQIDRVVIE